MSETSKTKTVMMAVTLPENLDLAKTKDKVGEYLSILFKKGQRGIQGQARLTEPETRDLIKALAEDLWKNHRGATVAGGLATVVVGGMVTYAGVQLYRQSAPKLQQLLGRKPAPEELPTAVGSTDLEATPAAAEEATTLGAELELAMPKISMTLTEWRQLVEMKLRVSQVDAELARLISNAIIVDDSDQAIAGDEQVSAEEIAGRIAAELEAHPSAVDALTPEELLMLFVDEPGRPDGPDGEDRAEPQP